MEPNRFDDVESRIVEEPSPPAPRRRPRRLGHAALAATAVAVLAGSLAAGASALTSTAQAPTRAAKQERAIQKQDHRWGHHRCHRGEGQAPAALDY